MFFINKIVLYESQENKCMCIDINEYKDVFGYREDTRSNLGDLGRTNILLKSAMINQVSKMIGRDLDEYL